MLRSLVIIVLLATIFCTPPAVVSTSIADANASINPRLPLIESQLRMELQTTVSSTGLAPASSMGVSVILRFSNELSSSDIQFAASVGVRFKERGGNPIHVGGIYLAEVTHVEALNTLGEIGLLQASSGSKQFFPSLSSSVPAIQAPAVWTDFGTNGSGTRVAIIDTGASWLHPSLWKPSTGFYNVLNSGSDFYLDIDNDTVIDTGEGPIKTVAGQTGGTIDYGEDYMYLDFNDNGRFDFAQGERWLGGLDENSDGIINLFNEKVAILGESKVAILYDQISSKVYVRGVNLTAAVSVVDTNGHGTHVASIIAGGIPGMSDFVGVAPGADLIVIRSTLDSEGVLDGIAFATENDADVINMSFSSYLGFLDGTDYEDLAISEAFMQAGTISTLAAGNLGGRPKHASFSVSSGSQNDAILAVSNPPLYSFLNVLWKSDNDDEHVILTPPDSEDEIDLGAFSDIASEPFALEHDRISAYVFPDQSIKGTNRVIIQVSTHDHFWDAGGWKIAVTNPSGDEIKVHAYAWDNSWSGLNMKFTSKLDYSYTISSPGTADIGITVASYNEITKELSATSSVGPRIDEVSKPLIAAPGDSIRAAYNSITSLWITRSGTSMAAPHVAGVLALIKSVSQDADGWRTLSALLQGAGGVDSHFQPASSTWGHGLVSPVWSIQQFISSTSPKWNGVPFAVEDGVDSGIDSSLDILNVSMYPTKETSWLRIGFRGVVNFSSSNVLTLNWDTDNSLATGYIGVDLKVNLSSGDARIYEWDGSAFVYQSSADWSADGQYLYLNLTHNLGIDFGRMEVLTGNSSHSEIDSTSTIQIEDLWTPVVDSFQLNSSGFLYGAHLEISDKDTAVSKMKVTMDIVDGDMTLLARFTETGILEIDEEFDLSEYASQGMLSLFITLTDEKHNLTYLPIPLSGGGSVELSIASGALDSEIVRVGFLIDEKISGNFTVEGHLLAAEVRVSLQHSSGLAFNISLTGENGEYYFEVSPSGLPLGEYEVYAVALTIGGEEHSLLLGHLSIIEDYSYVILIGGSAIGVGVLLLYIKRTRFQEV